MVLCRQLATGGQLTLHLHIVSRTWEVAAVSLDVRVKIFVCLADQPQHCQPDSHQHHMST